MKECTLEATGHSKVRDDDARRETVPFTRQHKVKQQWNEGVGVEGWMDGWR